MLDNRLGVFVILVAIIVLSSFSVLFKSCSKESKVTKAQSTPKSALTPKQANDVKSINLDEPMNRPHLPVKVELFQPENRFEVIGTDITSGTGLHWILVARTKGDGRMIFRIQLGDPKRFPIERGRIVRLGRLYFWQNSGYENNTLVVLGVE